MNNKLKVELFIMATSIIMGFIGGVVTSNQDIAIIIGCIFYTYLKLANNQVQLARQLQQIEKRYFDVS